MPAQPSMSYSTFVNGQSGAEARYQALDNKGDTVRNPDARGQAHQQAHGPRSALSSTNGTGAGRGSGSGQPQRQYERWQGKNYFLCDGRLILGSNPWWCLVTLVVTLVPFVLYVLYM